jgi:glutamate synthase (ferredoxin)
MTNGRVVVLGPTGRNFAAGMSGGIAYVLDEKGEFASLCNQDMSDLEPVSDPEDIHVLRGLIQKHRHYTQSRNAERILGNWAEMLPKFVKVYPRDYRRVVEGRKRAEMELMTRG